MEYMENVQQAIEQMEQADPASPDEDIMTALSENILENEEAAPNETEGKKKKSIVKVEKEIHFTDIKEVKDIVVF